MFPKDWHDKAVELLELKAPKPAPDDLDAISQAIGYNKAIRVILRHQNAELLTQLKDNVNARQN